MSISMYSTRICLVKVFNRGVYQCTVPVYVWSKLVQFAFKNKIALCTANFPQVALKTVLKLKPTPQNNVSIMRTNVNGHSNNCSLPLT